MAELKVNVGQEMGAVVAWSPNGDADLQKMADGFAKIGMGQFAPTPRTLKEALRAALVGEYSKKNQRVAPCGKGYEVTKEVQIEGQIRNEHIHILSASVERDQTSGNEAVVIDDPSMAEAVLGWVEAARKKVDSTAVGEGLTRVVEALRGVKIRDAGGAYWLPPASVGRWVALKEALEQAGRPVRMREFEQAATARTVAAVIDSVSSHVDSSIDKMLTAIESGELGERALAAKEQEAMDLADQLTEYEAVLGTKLDEIRARVQETRIRAMQASSIVLAAKDAKNREKALSQQYQNP